MRTLLTLFTLLTLLTTASASTITGTIRTPAGTGRITTVVFAPLSTPVIDSSVIVSTTQQTATSDSSGAFAIVLVTGNYRVTIGGKTSDSFLITVPNDALTHPLTELISVFSVFPSYVLKIGDTMSGFLTLSGAPTDTYHAANKGYVDDAIAAHTSGETNTASNVGAGEGLFLQKSDLDLQFRSLVAGAHITITSNASDITITGESGGSGSGTIPTGTGFTHNTSGSQDAASKLVDTADINSGQVTDAKIADGVSAAKIGAGAVSNTEFSYLDGVTSALQTQLDAKQTLDSDLTAVAGLAANGLVTRTATGTMSARTLTGTASEITVSNGDGVSGNPTLSLPTGISAAKIGGGAVSSTEFGYLDGVTSAIQTQMDLKAPLADPIFTGSLQLPNGTAPTTDAFGEVAGKVNAWALNRGAIQVYDGTANTYLVGVLASDTPLNGQVPTFNTGGTVDWQNPAGGGDALTSSPLAQFASTTSLQLKGVLSDETGSGAAVFATSPTLVTPALGVATATSLDSVTLLESGNAVPNATDTLAFFAATTSLQLKNVLSDETGSGAAVFATSPTLVTPVLGVAAATSVTAPLFVSTAGDPADAGVIRLGNAEIIAWEASPAGTDVTLTVDTSEVLQASAGFNAITITENGVAVPNVSDNLSVFAATTSAQLAGVISDETGTGLVALQTSPVFVTPRVNGMVPTDVSLGTVAAAGTATLVITTNIYRVIGSGSTATIALPSISIATNAYWLEVGWTNTSGGTQIITIPALFRKEIKLGVTTITNLIGADATISFYAQNGAWHDVSAVGDALSIATGSGDALVAGSLAQFAATTSLELKTVLSDETGSGLAVFATSPTLTTPVLGVAAATTINKVTLTAPATGSTLTIADGKTATVNNSITFAGTDSTTQTFPTTSGNVFSSVTKADVLEAAEFAADAGANDTYVITLAPAITAYVTGAHYRFKAATANTGAATLNINGVGAKTIVKVQGGITTTLADNDIRAGQWVDVCYDGTNLQMGSMLGNAPAGSGDALVANPLSQFAATTSAQFAGVISDETGSGVVVLATTPTLVTPVLGVATATSVNKVAITAPASSATLTIADGKTATVNNSLTLAGTDSTTQTFPATSGTVITSVTKADVLEAALFAADAGANDTYVITLSPAITAYVTGAHYRFKAATANTGAATLNINSVGAKTIVKVAGGITTTLADNDIRAGQWCDLVYDGTNLQLQSLLGNAPAGSGDALVANPLSQFASTTSLQLKGVLSDETGSGLAVFATTPTLTTPVLGVATATSITFPGGTILTDDNADALVLRRTSNPQIFYPYSTYTDAANYLRIALGYTNGIGYLVTQAAGTGTDGGLVVGTGGATALTLRTANTDRWNVSASGHLLATDNTYDIGAVGATRPRSVYVGTGITTPLINKVTITAPATGSTITLTDGKTLSVANTLTFAGTDSTTQTFQATDTIVGRATTDTLTNKTLDAAGTGNVLKFKGYLYLTHPHLADGTGATIGTTATALDYGHATFSNSADESANYVEYRLMVPTDIDTAVELRAKLKFRLGAADTATHRYTLNTVTQADSSAAAGTPGTPINLDFAGDASGASLDVETVGYTTLTGWAATMTADRLLVIRLARDGNASQDASTQNSTELGLVLEYGATQ